MKQVNISIHPFSALVGMAVLSMVWVSAAAMPLQGSSSDRDVNAVEVVSDPHPRDFMHLNGSQAYVVPAGKLLVVTAVGMGTQVSTGAGGTYGMDVEGQAVLRVAVSHSSGTGAGCGMVELPGGGYVVFPGQSVTMLPTGWGYLVDA